MGEAKPWQVAVIVIGVLVMVAGVVYQCKSGGVDFAHSIVLVDVASGEVIEAPFPEGRSVMFPAKNPETQTATLYPAELKDGKWFVEGRYIPLVQKVPDPKAMNLRTGAITTKTEEPVKRDVFEGT